MDACRDAGGSDCRADGQLASAQLDDDQPGQHVGQGHHHQRSHPRRRAGDVVRDGEPGDGRAGAVARGDREGQPGTDAADPHAGGQDARAAQVPAAGAEAQPMRTALMTYMLMFMPSACLRAPVRGVGPWVGAWVDGWPQPTG
jgi:hypothetical protein